MSQPLVLASQSPFRKALLQQLGLTFTTESPQVDERTFEEKFQGDITELALALSIEKAKSVATKHPKAVVIGSDQVLVFRNETLSKPTSLKEVEERLHLLAGHTHELHTGLCVIKDEAMKTASIRSSMTMRSLSTEQISRYATKDQPIGCAGGYKIEKAGPLLFSEVETSDHSSIIGLPLLSLVAFLHDWKISGL